MKMNMIFMLAITLLLTSVFTGCEQETKKAVPPDFVVNRVTDMYAMKDGKHFIFLSSNMNREYDYGRILLVEIKQDGSNEFKDSLLIPSIAGKMTVNSDESKVYVTSRDRQGITRYKIVQKDSSYRFDYEDSTDGYTSDILKTEKEPNAVVISPEDDKLFVSHIISGGLTIIDLNDWEKIKTYSLRKGVTSLIYDEKSGYYLASHRESGVISVIESLQTVSKLIVDIAEISFDMPNDGYDIRSLVKSSDSESIYAAFRNYSKNSSADTAPQLVSFAVKKEGGIDSEIFYTVPLRGSLGEMAVMPYSNGEGDDEVNGDLIFIASPGEKAVFIVDSIQKKVIDEISFDKKCEPYQLHYFQSDENNKGLLFVSCFINDRIMIYDIDLSSSDFFQLKGVIE
jgi:hypothetical protein